MKAGQFLASTEASAAFDSLVKGIDAIPLVDVTLPAEMVLDLESLMPEDVLKKLKNNQSIDFILIQKKI